MAFVFGDFKLETKLSPLFDFAISDISRISNSLNGLILKSNVELLFSSRTIGFMHLFKFS